MLVAVASVVTTIAGMIAIVMFLGPILRAIVHFEDLYKRLIPPPDPITGKQPACIVDRMETAESDIATLKRESGQQISTLARIEEATASPATTARDADMVRKLGGDQTRGGNGE